MWKTACERDSDGTPRESMENMGGQTQISG